MTLFVEFVVFIEFIEFIELIGLIGLIGLNKLIEVTSNNRYYSFAIISQPTRKPINFTSYHPLTYSTNQPINQSTILFNYSFEKKFAQLLGEVVGIDIAAESNSR